MNYPLRLTARQPEHWDRHTIGACFSISSAIPGNKSTMKAKPGEIILVIRNDQMQARVATEEEEFSPGSGGILRSKGIMDPDLMVIILNQSTVQKDLRAHAAEGASVLINLRARSLQDIIIGVPDPATQRALVHAHQDSVQWLHEYAAMTLRKSQILDQMSEAIASEILTGKADRKQSLLFVRDAMNPLIKDKNAIQSVSGRDIEKQGVDAAQMYVPKDQHHAMVDALEARIKHLEHMAEHSSQLSKSPRP